jgi:hypothetical protein
MNNEPPKTRKPYTLSPVALKARQKGATASVKARLGKAPGGATTADMVTLKVAPLTLAAIDERRKPGESRPACVHRAIMALKLPTAKRPTPSA